MIAGRLTIARAIATRWRSPPDIIGWAVGQAVPEPHALQGHTRRLASLRKRLACVQHPERDVVHGADRLLQVERLEDETRSRTPAAPRARYRKRRHKRARDRHLALGSSLERAKDRQHRRLARPRRPHDRDLLAA
jgi:hypothetical protein